MLRIRLGLAGLAIVMFALMAAAAANVGVARSTTAGVAQRSALAVLGFAPGGDAMTPLSPAHVGADPAPMLAACPDAKARAAKTV